MIEVTGNFEEFINDMDNFEKITLNKVNRVVKLITTEFFTAVIRDTPVDTGRMQNNWIFSHGKSPTYKFVDQEAYSKSRDGGPAKKLVVNGIKRAPGVIAKGENVTDYFLTNITPYGRMLELGLYIPKNSKGVSGGFSKKAIGGFMKKNLHKFAKMELTHIVKGVKGKL